MDNQINNLSPMEWAIYRYIRKKSYLQTDNPDDKWTTQRELVDVVNSDLTINDKLEYNEGDYNHCRRLWTIINGINQSGKVQKIIVTKNYKYKLGTKKECKEYFRKLRKDALLKLVRLSVLERRMEQNGQGQLLSQDLNPITDESSARGFLESLVPEVIDAFNEERGKQEKKGRKACRNTEANSL